MTRITGDVLALPVDDGRWVLYNVFARTSLGVETAALEALRSAERLEPAALKSEHPGPYRAWDVGWFSNVAGLLADPTRFIRDVAEWPEPRSLSGPALAELARERLILVDDEGAYRARFAPKTSLLDWEHIGNFHQQLGQELLIRRREDPADWWTRQKFTDDGSAVRDNLYGAIQASFLRDYLRESIGPGDRVLDVGCGTGFYTNLMAEAGGTVLGLDPTESYIERARGRAVAGAEFQVRPLGEEGAFDGLEDGSFDVIFMIDALLFYFVSPTPADRPDLGHLLGGIRRLLAPGGVFVSMEPHYTFWLEPWLGDPDRPYTVLTEYSRPVTGVTPSMSTVVRAFTGHGFHIADMRELGPAPSYRERDPRAYHFAAEFPLWQLFELRVA